MKGDSDDIKAKVTLDQLKHELRTESRAERRAQVVRETIEHLHSKTEVSADEMELCVEARLLDEPWQYRSLLSICGGNEQLAAQKVVEHMMDGAQHGHRLLMNQALADCEMLANEIIMSPASEWGEFQGK